MKDIKKLIEDIVHERNEVIARLAYWEGVNLTISDYSSFHPDADAQEEALEEITELAMYLEDEYRSFSMPEVYQFCKEKHMFNENWSGIWKDDALKLLGLDSNTDVDLLFSGVVE